MEPLKISVIIPSYNPDLGTLMECLNAIYSSSLKPFEIILVDDGSTIKYPDEISFYCRIIRNKTNMGPAYTRNVGAKEAKGDILCFIDSDVKIKPTTLSQIADKFSKTDIAAVQTVYSTFTPVENFISQYQNLYLHYNFKIVKEKYLSTFASHCIAIRKDLFFEVKGFDEEVKTASIEDEHLGTALYSKGYKILLAKDITVEHMDYINFKKLLRRMFIMGREWIEHFIKNPKTREIKLSKTHHPLNLIASILISPLILFFLIFVTLPIVRNFILLLVLIFLLINAHFFIFMQRNKGVNFMIKSIITYYLVCFSIFLGFIKGTLNIIK